jgi:hypothetical protein
MLWKVLFNLIKENHGLHEDDDISEHMIPITFNEETEFLIDSMFMLINLKCNYMNINGNYVRFS